VAVAAGGAERFERLIDRADQAMYRAKLAGKDRWEAAPPSS
jgi:PleD family two-component response regulator